MESILKFFNAEFFSIILFFLGFYGLISSANIIKSVLSILIMEIAAAMFFVGVGFVNGMTPPIGTNLENASDPLPQALVLTAIIIGVAVAAVNLTMLITLYRQYKTTEWESVKRMNTE